MFCRTKLWTGAAAVLLVSGAAWAGESTQVGAEDFGSPMAQESLDERRARNGNDSTFNLTVQELDLEVKHNRAIGNINGSNYMSGNAFRDSMGLAQIVQNTGNNCGFQNALIIRVDMQ